MKEVKILRMNENAKLPERGSEGSCGYDLFASEDVILPPSSIDELHKENTIPVPLTSLVSKRILIPTGLRIEFDEGYARIAPRSSLSLKGLDIGGGVIDKDYRGEIKIILINNTQSNFPIKISKGDKIAQLIFESCSFPKIQEFSLLTDTKRGQGGFGSTGN